MRVKNRLLFWLIIVIAGFAAAAACVYHVDPYFHYHEPYTDRYYYYLSNVKQRSQNDGITKHFEYDAIITGTSLTENFRTSEMDELFDCHSIKVPYSGSSFKEINDNLAVALKSNPDLKTVLRCVDLDFLMDPVDYMRTDLGVYPTYLYDDDPFNDVEYLLNRDIVFRASDQLADNVWPGGESPGITSFDEYSNWQNDFKYGINATCPDGVTVETTGAYVHLGEEERKLIYENITKNVTDLADEYPDVDFYYYYSPYSILKWLEMKNDGSIIKRIEAEKYATELILQHSNIRLFSFNTRFDIITDLNNYRDTIHYASWVNSLILKWMHDGSYRLTKDNYEEYLREESEFYLNYDYASLNDQEDYEADYYAGALLNRELTGAEPLDLINSGLIEKTAEGGMITVDLNEGYNYLAYKGQHVSGQTYRAVRVNDENGFPVGEEGKSVPKEDRDLHMHVIELSPGLENITIVFNGVFPGGEENNDSDYLLYEVYLY